jgi:hypothetical protein
MLYRKAASPAEEHLRRQIAPMFMEERTPGRDGLRRHRLDGCRDILAATLALNHHALGAFRSGDMRNIGEQKANLFHSGSELGRRIRQPTLSKNLNIVVVRLTPPPYGHNVHLEYERPCRILAPPPIERPRRSSFPHL